MLNKSHLHPHELHPYILLEHSKTLNIVHQNFR